MGNNIFLLKFSDCLSDIEIGLSKTVQTTASEHGGVVKDPLKRFDVKFRGRLGPEANDDKEIRILNRMLT